MTKELIKITTNKRGSKLVSARELYEFLEVKSVLSTWFKRMCEYGFKDGVDYCEIWNDSKNGNVVEYLGSPQKMSQKGYEVDYIINIDMAKEISMIQRSDKGKEARQYFIACENKLKEIDPKANLLLSIYNGGQGGILASKQLAEIEVQEAVKPLETKIEADRPKVEFAEQVSESQGSMCMSTFAKLVNDEDIKIGSKTLFKWLRKNGYLRGGEDGKKDKWHLNEPYQKYINNGVFELMEYSPESAIKYHTKTKTLVTGKGQVYLLKKLKEYFKK